MPQKQKGGRARERKGEKGRRLWERMGPCERNAVIVAASGMYFIRGEGFLNEGNQAPRAYPPGEHFALCLP